MALNQPARNFGEVGFLRIRCAGHAAGEQTEVEIAQQPPFRAGDRFG